jgi:hypothetical protein
MKRNVCIKKSGGTVPLKGLSYRLDLPRRDYPTSPVVKNAVVNRSWLGHAVLDF